MSPRQQYISMVPRGGVGVTLVDAKGNPYATTGEGAMVFNREPVLYNPTIHNATFVDTPFVSVVTAGTGLGATPNPIVTTGTIFLADTTVVPGIYGTASDVPRITVDAQGRITHVETQIAASGLVVGASGVAGGVNGNVFFNDNGILGELPVVGNGSLLTDAPNNINTYARQGGNWTTIPPEAPVDGIFYGRKDAVWVALTTQVNLSVDSLADLKALAPGASRAVYNAYRSTPGDQGGGTWNWRSGDQSANITADPLSGRWAAPNSAPTGASGAWERYYEGAVNISFWRDAGTTDYTAAIQAAIDSLDDVLGGEVGFPDAGPFLTSAPIIIDKPRVALVGHGGGGWHLGAEGATEIRGSHLLGPVIRAKKAWLRLENLVVSATPGRTAATMITKDNYVVRDDQNYGIWIEPDDTADSINVLNLIQQISLKDVFVTGQPNTNWVIGTACYSSVIDHCGSSLSKGHGIVITAGAYTDRTHVMVPGVMEIRTWASIANAGHGFVAGTPDDSGAGPSTIRLVIDNLDMYNNGLTNPALMYAPYAMYFVSDNSCVINSAMSGNSVYGALYLHGRNVDVKNTRVLLMPDSPVPGPVPIRVAFQHGAANRVTQGIDIDTITCPQGTHVDLVEVVPGALDVSVRVKALDGTFSGLASGAQRTDRVGVRKWDGSLEVPTYLSGKSVSDDTTQGVRIVGSAGFLSAVRNGGPPQILNRLTSNGDVLLLRKDGVGVGHHGVATTSGVSTVATAIYPGSGSSGGLVTVSGGFNDGGTVRRFWDVVMYANAVAGATVIASKDFQFPAARTYTVGGANLLLAMASGTYDIRAFSTQVLAAV